MSTLNMNNPANSVNPSLLRHLHLVINKSIALPPQPSLDLIVDNLLQAPQAVQHSNTVAWRFLADPPRDGTNMLVWQPPQMSTNYASDGYMWLDAELSRQSEVKGHKLEVFIHRSGFRPGQEQFATHARRRYRLLENPLIWLVCYRPAEPRDQSSIQGAKLPEGFHALLRERDSLTKAQTQLVRKEFMLHDVANYPVVMPPGAGQRHTVQQNMEYPSNVMAHLNKSQQAAYKQQQQQLMLQQQSSEPVDSRHASHTGFDGSPAKRVRRGSPGKDRPSSTAIPGPNQKPSKSRGGVEDFREEVVMDYMDAITPRELAVRRYLQHHEWLEEVLNSPYDTRRIVPPQLGLGRKGELESLTRDFFHAPVKEDEDHRFLGLPGTVDNVEQVKEGKPVVMEWPVPRVGRLPGRQAQDFRSKAFERLQEIAAEIEDMKEEHEKKIAEVRREDEFDKAVPEFKSANGAASVRPDGPSESGSGEHLDEVLRSLERKYGKQIQSVPMVECIDKGGREEIVQSSKRDAQDYDMAESFDLDGARLVDAAGSKANVNLPSDQNSNTAATLQISNSQIGSQGSPAKATPTAEIGMEIDHESPADEGFVMVDKEEALPPPSVEAPKGPENISYTGVQDDGQNIGGVGLNDFDGDQDVNFEPNDFGEGIDFGDMDTAGDELSGYAQEIANMGGARNDDLGLDSPTLQTQSPGFGAPPSGGDSSAP